MIISLISQKGGVGKSSLARLIAVEYAKSGWSVKIADLDKNQGTATKWKLRREANFIKPEIAVGKYATVERAIRDAEQYDLMVLDGPTFTKAGNKTMAAASDLVIMPTGYAVDDLRPQVETVYDLEGAGIDPGKIIFVFCRANASDSEDIAVRKYLKRAGMTVIKPIFPERVSIGLAHDDGRAASEVSHQSLKTKVLAVVQAIVDIIEKKGE